MRHRYVTTSIIVFFGMVLSFGSISCGGKKESKTSLNAETVELVKRYQEMKMAGLRGQVSRFVHMRDSVSRWEVAGYFHRTGRVIDSATVYQWAFTWPDVAGLPLVQDSINGRWRRLIFRKCGLLTRDSVENCVFSIILFGKDGDQWNVSNACKIGARQYNADGSEVGVENLTFNDLFLLPPSFEPLYNQKPADSTAPPPTFREIDPRDIKPGAKPKGSK